MFPFNIFTKNLNNLRTFWMYFTDKRNVYVREANGTNGQLCLIFANEWKVKFFISYSSF